MCTPYVGRGPLNTTQIIFSVKILEALDNQIRSLSLCVYLGSFFTSNLIYADNNAETGDEKELEASVLRDISRMRA